MRVLRNLPFHEQFLGSHKKTRYIYIYIKNKTGLKTDRQTDSQESQVWMRKFDSKMLLQFYVQPPDSSSVSGGLWRYSTVMMANIGSQLLHVALQLEIPRLALWKKMRAIGRVYVLYCFIGFTWIYRCKTTVFMKSFQSRWARVVRGAWHTSWDPPAGPMLSSAMVCERVCWCLKSCLLSVAKRYHKFEQINHLIPLGGWPVHWKLPSSWDGWSGKSTRQVANNRLTLSGWMTNTWAKGEIPAKSIFQGI